MIQPRYNLFKLTRALALAFLIVTPQLAGLAQAPAPAAAPAAPPPYQWPRSHDYDVQHYKIAVSFDWTKKSVRGETTITFRPFKNDLKEVEIDAGQMKIESVRLASGNPLKYRYEGDEKLYVTLDHGYSEARDVSIVIGYSATPTQGLTFITPSEADPTRPYQIWSQGEAKTNHYWFPCYDYPNDKATSELIATVEEKYQVISNGELVGPPTDAGNKTKTWHWRMDKPVSSYLVSIIVGQYEQVKGEFKSIPVVSNVYPGQIEEGRISFGKLPDMVAFFSEKIGYDYPYAKYAQTMVRDFGGAMENVTATTMTDNAVHDRRAHLDLSSDDVVSHELAHQWFGDLLTCRDWGEIWLNESFATFFEALWTEHDKGKDDFLYEMLKNQKAYYKAWDQGMRRPIVTKRYADPDALFDAYAYPRGGAVLSMLRFTLGDELFWKAIRHYVKKYQWQNVETPQLIVAIEEATGQNLSWFFDEWVYKMGHPEFTVTSNFDASAKSLKLAVKQTVAKDDKNPWFQEPEYFTMPVDIAVTTSSGEHIHRVWIDQPDEEFTFAVDSKPLIVNFDRGNYLIKQVKFDRSQEELAYQLLHDRDVMGRVLAVTELAATKSESAAAALSEAARSDSFWGVRLEATQALAELKTDQSRRGLLEAVKDKDSRIRREAIKGLAKFKDPNLADLFVNVIRTDPSYFAISEAATALGQSGAPQAGALLSETLKQESWNGTIRAGAIEGLAALADPATLDTGLKYAAPKNPLAVRAASFKLLAGVGKGNKQALDSLIATLRESSFQIRFAAIQALLALGDPRALPALEQLAKSDDLPSFARGFVLNAINQIKNPKKEEEKKN